MRATQQMGLFQQPAKTKTGDRLCWNQALPLK
jgi:hypothetical protein